VGAFLWREAARLLDVDAARLAADRPLIGLGLDSLTAAELAAAIETGLGVRVDLSTLLAGATLAELEALVARQLAGVDPGALEHSGTTPVAGGAVAGGISALEDAAGAPSPVAPARWPLSHGQRSLWLLDRLVEGGNPAYVLAGAARIRGTLDAPRLHAALAALVARHAALRSTFEPDGDDCLQVVRGETAFTFIEEDAAGWSETRLRQRLADEAHRPFDLAQGPLLRVSVWHRAPGGTVLVLAVHHIVADFWSLGILLNELGTLYRGGALPPAAGSHLDFLRWQESRLEGVSGKGLADYWRGILEPAAPPLDLPADRPRPPVQAFRGGSRSLRFGRDLTEQLGDLGRRAGATRFMTLLAAFAALLHRFSGQEEMQIGAPAAGRGAPGLAGMVGYFANPVVVRASLAGDPTFGELLARLRGAAIAAFAHQDYPFPLLAERLGGRRDPSRSPLFDAQLVFYREAAGAPGLGGFALGLAGARLDLGGGLALESIELPRRIAQLDLSLLAAEIDGALAASLQYDAALFDAATAERMLACLRTLAAAAAGRSSLPVSRLPLLDEAARHQVLWGWNDSADSADSRQAAPAAAYVLDRHLAPQPPGVPGELLLAGAGLAPGDLGRPDLAAERFIPDPYAGAPGGGRLYRTGDLARRRADGSLELLGRIDRQVKGRGLRIEPAEIEAGGEAATATRAAPRTETEKLLARLWVQVLPAFSWTGAGSRASADADPEVSIAADDDFFALGGHSLIGARMLARLRDLTGVELPLRTLFEEPTLAGLARRVEAAGAVVASPSPTQAAAAPSPSQGASPSPTQGASPSPTQDAAPSPSQGAVAAPFPAALPASVGGAGTPLSHAQRRLWFLAQLAPELAAYNIAGLVAADGPLDAAALSWALDELVRRHQVLRTRFTPPPAGAAEPLQVVLPPSPLLLPVVDLAALPPPERQREAARIAGAGARRPFDLAAGRPLRTELLRLAPQRHQLLVTLHHLVSDGRSHEIVLEELAALYAARIAGAQRSMLPELPLQYSDWAAWERQRLTGERLAEELAYWRHHLAGLPPRLELPADRPRPPRETWRGGEAPLRVDAEVVAHLEAAGRGRRATLFMTCLAALQALLHRYTGQQDLLIGTPVANRQAPGADRLVGFFANTLAMRGDLSGPRLRFGELLERVREAVLQDLAHQEMPFERLVEELAPRRAGDRSPLLQVVLALQAAPLPRTEAAGLALAPAPLGTGTAKFDLTFVLTAVGAAGAAGADGARPRLEGVLEYRRDLFDAATAARLAGHWQVLLGGLAATVATVADVAHAAHVSDIAGVAAADPYLDELPLLAAAERHQLLTEWRAAPAAYPRESCVHELFAAQARFRPQAVAVSFGDQRLIYEELDRLSSQTARRLARLGAVSEARVAIWIERSLEMVVALLAVLKCGGAYVPLDPGWPRRRLELVLAQTGARLLVSKERRLRDLPAGLLDGGIQVLCLDGVLAEPAEITDEACTGEERAAPVGPENLAYVMFTSGSTGQPKGVAVTHRGIVRLVRESSFADFGPDQVHLQLAPLAFDASTYEIWAPLLNGGRLAVFPPRLPDLRELGAELESQGVTTLFLTTGLFHQVVESNLGSLRRLDQLLTGGEALSGPHARRALAELPEVALVNCYGPTEITVIATCHALRSAAEPPQSAGTVPIGRPIANTSVQVLDRHARPVPAGVPGELLVGGDGLARGYLGRPDLTAERFVPDPRGGGSRLYRTGDLARWLPDGVLDFLGRIDQQVKIRGFRIEPGEIEAALAGQRGVEQSLVMVREAGPGDRRLVAYVVPRAGASLDAAGLRSAVASQLPAYMVPAAFVFLAAMPFGPSGKVDRKALPAPEWVLADAARPRSRPLDAEEELLAALWTELLGGAEDAARNLSPEDDFFALGGHSLLATRLVSRLREALGIEVPLRSIFEAPTLAGLAHQVRAAGAKLTAAAPAALPRPAGGAGTLLSHAQRRLWFLARLAPESAAYNIAGLVVATGALDVAALSWALDELVRRHQVLRTRFAPPRESGEGAGPGAAPHGGTGEAPHGGAGEAPHGGAGEPLQVVVPAFHVPLPVVDLAALPPPLRQREAARIAEAGARRPFDLAAGRPLRTELLRLAPERHRLLVTVHHLVSDGRSHEVILEELAALYAARIAGAEQCLLPDLPFQYSDWAAWERQRLTGERLAAELAYWRHRLAGLPPRLQLPADRPRPPRETWRGGEATVRVEPEAVSGLAAAGRRHRATMFMTCLAALQALLHRYTGQEDLLVGTPVANRQAPGADRLVGFFANTLVMRGDLSGPRLRFGELLERVREAVLQDLAHQEMPFERLVEELAPQRAHDRSPLLQVVLALQAAPLPRTEAAGLALAAAPLGTGTAKFDLTFALAGGGEGARSGLEGVLEYRRDLFDPATAARLAGHWQVLLGGLGANVAGVAGADPHLDELPLLAAAERHQLLAEWPSAAAAYPRESCVHELFAAQARLRPQAPAVSFGDRQLTYEELDRLSGRIARRLTRLGAGPEAGVAIWIERSLEMVAALLAVLKCGGAYVPLDPSWPRRRLELVLAQTGTRLLVSQERRLRALPAGLLDGGIEVLCLDGALAEPGEGTDEAGAGEEWTAPVRPENLACVMYTSGSTGRPKGVAVTHRGIVRLVRENWFADFRPHQVYLQLAPLAFDASTFEIWGPLLNGARLAVFPPRLPDLQELGAELESQGVTTLFLTTGLFHQVVESNLGSLRRLDQLLAGGEALSGPHARRVLAELPGVVLVNGYGPTESTVFATCHRARAAADLPPFAGTVPIGRPIANTSVHVLDRHARPVPIGVPGELLIGGDGLARGYLGRPDLTAERFVPDPIGGGGRVYRTGDLVRWLPDGVLDFLGRIDQQVKIRGFRIEPAEIEAVLAGQPGVEQVRIVAREAGPGDRRLVAYVVPRAGARVDAADLRAAASRQLPVYMVPAAFVFLAAMPLGPNGKVDRRALPAPEWVLADAARSRSRPLDAEEELLAAIWTDLLGGPEDAARNLSPEDDFFALGGHSLLATRLVSRLREVLGIELPLRSIFEAPTLAALAGLVRASRGGALPAPGPGTAEQGFGDGARAEELSFAQERLWFLNRLDPDDTSCNVAGGLLFEGSLDPAVLARSLYEIVRRHHVLRSVFRATAAGGMQVVLPQLTLQLPLADLTRLGAAATPIARGLGRELARRPFDLTVGPLVRTTLLRIGAGARPRHLLVLVLHHIVADGWSFQVFLRELLALYPAVAGGVSAAAGLPELPVQYADFTRWQRAWLQGEAMETLLAHWRQALAGAPGVLALPSDRPRPPVRGKRGATVLVQVSAGVAAGLRRVSRQGGATLFMTLLAVLDVLLHRFTGQPDLVVGSPIANRERAEFEGLIGCFVNTLALRVKLGGPDDPACAKLGLRELLGRVRDVCLAAYAHQDLPFEKLVESLAPERDLATTPLFQVLLGFQAGAGLAAARSWPSVALCDIDPGIAQFDLSVRALDTAGGLALALEYSLDLFDAATVKRLAGHFRNLLEGVAALAAPGRDPAPAPGSLGRDPAPALGSPGPDPTISSLPWLSAAERHQLREWNATANEDGDALRLCLHEPFEEQARRSPEAVAVCADGDGGADHLSYGALNAAANRLARHLRRLGAGPETVAAIAVERCCAMMVGLLAILKAGAAYLPLDPDYPQERLHYMLEDSGAPLLLTQRPFGKRFGGPGAGGARGTGATRSSLYLDVPPGRPSPWSANASGDLGAVATPANLAYVIYTSGSTGRPKGTMNSHRGIANRLLWMQERHGLGADDRVLQKTPLGFDVSVWELFWPLANGACLVLARPGGHRDPAYLHQVLVEHQVTTVHFVPAMLRALLESLPPPAPGSRPPFAALRRVVASGEALGFDLQQRHAEKLGAPLYNLYGPTEAAVDVTCWRCDPAGSRRLVPIGSPVENTRIHLLDGHGDEVPVGVHGELHIGGVQLGRGYLGRPALTAEKFVPDAFGAAPGGRLYRSGDLARWLPDGAIDYLGRIDDQVKIRGVRIELGEVEAAIGRLPEVQQAAVVVHEGSAADRWLLACVTLRPAAGQAAIPAAVFAAWQQRARAALGRELPEPMIPAVFVQLPELPLSPSGKVDRKALAARVAAEGRRAAGGAGRVGPRTAAELRLGAVWAEVLHLAAGPEQVAVDDSFFTLGGHSLLAFQLLARVRQSFGVELPLRRVFESPTLAAQAREIESLLRRGQRLPVLTALPRAGAAAGQALALPLSFAQERLWFLDQLAPGKALYNVAGAFRMRGRLDVAALSGALARIRRRHEVLRTAFAARDGVVGALVAAPGREPALRLPLADLRGLPAARREAVAAGLAAEEARRRFDLGSGLPVRACLLRLAAGQPGSPGAVPEHLLLVSLHHIVSDGWSLGVLVRELEVFYEAGVSRRPPARHALPELPIQYADFAHWQREWLAGEVLAAELAYWREQLAGARGAPPALELPLDRPRRPEASLAGARRGWSLPVELSGELQAAAQRQGATVFMTLLAALATLLSRYGGESDLTIGTPVANRDRPEVQNLIGLFVNTLVLRLDLAGDPAFRDLLARSRQTALAAYSHQDLPFEKVVGELAPRRGAEETPLFQVVLAFQPPPLSPRLQGLVFEPLDADTGTAKFDLSLALHQTAAGALAGAWTYRTELFDPATVERLGCQLRNLLRAAVACPDDRLSALPLLAPAERHQLLAEWNDGAWVEAGDDLLQAPFLRRAARQPDAVALVAGPDGHMEWAAGFDGHPPQPGEQAMTYGELAARAQGLADRLRGLGLGPEGLVGICAEPSFDLVAGLLAILQAGGAFLPLDPANPPERLAQVVAESGAELVLAAEQTLDRLPRDGRIVPLAAPPSASVRPDAAAPSSPSGRGEALPGAPLPAGPPWPPGPPGPAAARLAYVIYTSGSTGAPKGVMVPHQAVVNRLRFQLAADLAPGARVLQRTRLGFDVSLVEIFGALWAGATLVLADGARQHEAGYLAGLMASQQVTNANLPPGLLSALLDEEALDSCRALRLVITGGDRVPSDLELRYRVAVDGRGSGHPAPVLMARYGPTEATISMSEWRCSGRPPAAGVTPGPSVPLGRPIAGARWYVLDHLHREVPRGAPGELCIAGMCLARGYRGRPDLTAAAFIPDPFASAAWSGGGAGGRLYRTGDLARHRADGAVEFLGRVDHQVKIRGFRLELGEVEAALARHPEVAQAVVVDRDEPATGGKRLVAYVVVRGGGEPPQGAAGLRGFLAAKLPAFMVPAVFVFLDALPLTANGAKVDRRALPAPSGLEGRAEALREAPRTALEQTIAGLWRELLQLEQVGIRENFFDLGGHSLLLARLHARLQEALGRPFAMLDLFQHPTIESLAQHLSQAAGRAAAPAPDFGPAQQRAVRKQEAFASRRQQAAARRGRR